jgi:hypothetical protein
MLTPESTVAAQYANSPRILALINGMNSAIDPSVNINKFYSDMWNISTAVGYGLDCWGRIVGVSRVITIPPTVPIGDYLGFAESGDADCFGFGVWYLSTGGNNFSLSDDAYRLLILAKASANISDCSIASINRIMTSLFLGRGKCYVQDNNDMTLTYVFTFITTPVEKSVIQGSGVLPNPTGVLALYSFA